jgi:hypothetical protein
LVPPILPHFYLPQPQPLCHKLSTGYLLFKQAMTQVRSTRWTQKLLLYLSTMTSGRMGNGSRDPLIHNLGSIWGCVVSFKSINFLVVWKNTLLKLWIFLH